MRKRNGLIEWFRLNFSIAYWLDVISIRANVFVLALGGAPFSVCATLSALFYIFFILLSVWVCTSLHRTAKKSEVAHIIAWNSSNLGIYRLQIRWALCGCVLHRFISIWFFFVGLTLCSVGSSIKLNSFLWHCASKVFANFIDF